MIRARITPRCIELTGHAPALLCAQVTAMAEMLRERAEVWDEQRDGRFRRVVIRRRPRPHQEHGGICHCHDDLDRAAVGLLLSLSLHFGRHIAVEITGDDVTRQRSTRRRDKKGR